MESEWMGRYRRLVGALVRHANITAKNQQNKENVSETLMLNAVEWQVLEAIVEHRFESSSMILISESIGVPQSTFSKITKSLCDKGYVEKYQAVNNKKNIILKPSESALKMYEEYSQTLRTTVFREFFRILDPLDDAAVETVTQAIEALNETLLPKEEKQEIELIKKT